MEAVNQEKSTLSVTTPDDFNQDKNPFILDPNRVYYYSQGLFRHTWDHLEVDPVIKTVRVIWANGYSITLEKRDAIKLLRMTKSRFYTDFTGEALR